MFLYERFKELRAKFSLEDLVLIFTRTKAELFETQMREEAQSV
jgi:hypothetical protein